MKKNWVPYVFFIFLNIIMNNTMNHIAPDNYFSTKMTINIIGYFIIKNFNKLKNKLNNIDLNELKINYKSIKNEKLEIRIINTLLLGYKFQNAKKVKNNYYQLKYFLRSHLLGPQPFLVKLIFHILKVQLLRSVHRLLHQYSDHE